MYAKCQPAWHLQQILCGVLLPLQKGYLSIQNTSTLVGKRPPFRGLNVIFGISKSEKGLCHFHICIFFFKFFFNRSKCQYSDKKIQSHRGWLITASLHLLWVGFFFFAFYLQFSQKIMFHLYTPASQNSKLIWIIPF